MSMRTAHSGSGVVTVLMHGSDLSSSSIAEALSTLREGLSAISSPLAWSVSLPVAASRCPKLS